MIYNMRIYDLKPGKLQEYMSAMREVAVPLRREYGVPLAGWFYTEIGSINRIYHIWAYKDLEHYEQKKEEVYTDPRWVNEYIPRVLPLIESQYDQMVKSADFWNGFSEDAAFESD